MLDVHPPHSKIRSVGEFFLHILTITVGLFIALILESAVQSVHHRHQREQAESDMRQEIRANNAKLADSHKAVAREQANLLRAMEFLKARQANKPYDISGISLAFQIVPLNDASWRTASATGVLSFMNYDNVQLYAAAYHMQDAFTDMQRDSLDSFLQLHSYVVGNPDLTKMPKEEVAEAMIDVRHAYAHLDALEGISQTLATDYKQALATQ